MLKEMKDIIVTLYYYFFTDFQKHVNLWNMLFFIKNYLLNFPFNIFIKIHLLYMEE